MGNVIVRIESMEIRNFKNITCGKLKFTNPSGNYEASILGLYGQNGSGKTGLIEAISLLKYALCGMEVPRKFADCISVNEKAASLKYRFRITDPDSDTTYTAVYEFKIEKELADDTQNTENILPGKNGTSTRVSLREEVLSYSYCGKSGKQGMSPLIDTRTGEVFSPKTKYDVLTGKKKSLLTDLIVAKKLAAASSRSFVFSKELLDVIRKNCREEKHLYVLNSLVNYGNYGLFIIDTRSSGLISLDVLPLFFRYKEKTDNILGAFTISLNNPMLLPDNVCDSVSKVIDNMNIVLKGIIPGLTIGVEKISRQILPDGKQGSTIQLMSNKNGKAIPFKYESEGIKKIVSMLQLLISVYNNPSVTVAIDELDSGVFEYLLGEILRIIAEKGKGQLIFTSHNLRPLETLDKGFIAFTTTNPENRYIRLGKVKPNNNLRDFYYRDIVLGEQNEPVYDTTDNYEIAMAFREAGEVYGA